MTTRMCPLCMVCKHLYENEVTYTAGEAVYHCEAFPKGIPEDVLWNGHTHVIKGDNGVQFELDESKGDSGQFIAMTYFNPDKLKAQIAEKLEANGITIPF